MAGQPRDWGESKVNWQQELVARAELINNALEVFLPQESCFPPRIHEAMRYSLFAGGKRLRGALTLATAGVLGVDEERVLPAAAAIEMIHTYSLIHDDLPAMDNDDYRRGRPTCHRVYGEAVAILAGDALLTLAFEIFSKLTEEGFDHSAVVQVIQEVAVGAGSLGLIGGQVVDLESEGKEISAAILEYIHCHKTGALFKVAVRSGAILAGAGEQELKALTDYAEAFGLAFQITDDILDITGNEEILGKKTGRDLVLHKATYPELFGLDKAREQVVSLVKICLKSTALFGSRAEFLQGAAHYLLARQS